MTQGAPLPRSEVSVHPRAVRGFTVIELMVTMAIASALLALGAGMFLRMGRRTAVTQAITDVNLLVTKARNASSRYPAELVADPKENTLSAKIDEVLQELHFEARPIDGGEIVPMGIEGRDCTIVGGDVVADGGRVGGGARLNGGGISCGNFAAYDVDQGVSAEAWIRPATPPKCDVVSKGRTFQVRLETIGSAASRVVVKVLLQDPLSGAQEAIERSVAIPLVRVGEWIGVRASYDGREIVVATDDGYGPIVRDRYPETRRLAVDAEAELRFGSGLDGWIDDCRFGGVRASDPVRLPEGMSVVSEKRIRFLDGRLDASVHPGSEKLAIRSGTSVTTFDIGPNGTILGVKVEDAPAAPVPDGAAGGGQGPR